MAEELISRNDLLKAVDDIFRTDDSLEIARIRGLILKAPAVFPVKGKQIDTDNTEEIYDIEYRCSVCGGITIGKSDYCEWCGCEFENDE